MAVRSSSPTMRDVARLAGVSIQTVSAVVNDKPGITGGTRDRVRAVIQEVGYRPYPVARSLRTRKTRTLALIISDIANPSFATMASAAEEVAHSFGYSLIVYNTHDDISRESACIAAAVQRWVDGILFVAAQDKMAGLEALCASGVPAVALDRIPDGYIGLSVTLDNVKAGEIAADYLLGLGHRRFGHISGPLRLRLARERLEGFLATLAWHGLAPGTEGICEGSWECRDGYRAMKELLARSPAPTAVLAANDRMAIGAMAAAQEQGLRVPADLSIIGLDDIELAAYQNPPLTTIRQSFAELATLGIKLLLGGIMGEPQPSESRVVAPELVVRASAGAAPP